MASKGLETRLQRRIKDALEKEFGGAWYKIHGGPYQEAGIPDLVGCCRGLFFALEIKLPGKETTLSPIQKHQIHRIVMEGHGIAGMVTSVEEATNLVGSRLILPK